MQLKKTNYKWYAVYTKVNSEKKIYSALQEQGIECYLPLKKTLRQWSDRKKWIEEPLFRSYIFVKVSHLEFFNVLAIPGAVCYVSFGARAQSIPEKQILDIKTMIQNKEKEVVLTRENIEKGQQAVVLAGPMKGVKGEIVEVCGQYRIVIRVESMGCCLYTNISKEEVEVVTPLNSTHQKVSSY